MDVNSFAAASFYAVELRLRSILGGLVNAQNNSCLRTIFP
jgi:hypothetical protein